MDVFPVLLQVSLCYRSVLIPKDARDVPFLVGCQLREPVDVAQILLDYFLSDSNPSGSLCTRLWYMKDSGRALTTLRQSFSGGPPSVASSSPAPQAGGGLVSSGQVTPDRAGSRKSAAGAIRETEGWELIAEGVCLANLHLQHQDRLLVEVKDSQGEKTNNYPRSTSVFIKGLRVEWFIGRILGGCRFMAKRCTGRASGFPSVPYWTTS